MNGPDDVYVERKGRIERAGDGLFEGEEAVAHLIERIVGPLGLRVDESSPWADARLPEGSRVHTRFLNTPFMPRPQPADDSRMCSSARSRGDGRVVPGPLKQIAPRPTAASCRLARAARSGSRHCRPGSS